jgi:methyltransferase (TIGR00027 family)
MSDRDASRTALGTAYLRAAHQLLDAPPRILEDPVAIPLLGPDAERRIRETAEQYATPARRALRAHLVLRSRYAEDRLAAAVARGVSQYVVLGAGFDTFALRQPPWARALRILEVDHAGTQAVKRARLAAAGLSMPPNADFASIDFERKSLGEGLQRQGLSLEQPTFFSWLGVTMYLEERAIDAVLASIATFPAGSEVVLTFATPRGQGPSHTRERAEALGEPWLTAFEPEALGARLRAAGFGDVAFLSAEDAEGRYFRQRPADLPPPQRTNLVCAVR